MPQTPYHGLTLFVRFSVLVGPINHLKHLITAERLPFTAIYFSSLGLTLYFALGVHILCIYCRLSTDSLIYQLHSYIGCIVGSVVQVFPFSRSLCCTDRQQILALLSYVMAYFPGGSATLRLAGSTAFRSATGSLLPR
jgi:hypothetical protein